MTCNRYHLWAALDVHAFSKAEAVLRFSAEEDGMWVQWQDYARLKAEVERLKAELADEKSANASVEGRQNSANRGLSMRNHLLQAEVERLTKAGDAMAECLLKYIEPTDGYLTYLECRANWTAAKEGKQP